MHASSWHNGAASLPRLLVPALLVLLLTNGALSHTNALDTPLTLEANRKLNKYQATYANTHGISFRPAITSTSTRMHGEFLRHLFLQAHRETAAYFTFMGVPAQPTQTDMFRFRRAAFYSALKSKVGLVAAKAAALRVNMEADSCMGASHAASRHTHSHAPALFHSSLTHTLPRPRGAWGAH